MARTTLHPALEGAGFKLQGSEFNGSSDRVGTAMTHHYTTTRNTLGDGGIVRPITHHIFVDEFSRAPGKYNVSYHLTQGGEPFLEGRHDTLRRHKDNANRGVADPIKDILEHHRAVSYTLDRGKPPNPLVDITPDNLHKIRPDSPFHAIDFGGKDLGAQINRGPGSALVSYNAVEDRPLDPHVHRWLTGGAKGRPTFEYQGKLGPETDVYHSSREDPEDPYMRYGFTVRHMPGATSAPHVYEDGTVDPVPVKPLVFSYNATHYPIDMPDENGEHPVGDFLRIPGEDGPVANFTELGPLIERHHNMLRSLGLMDLPPREPRPAWHFTASVDKTADEFDNIIRGNGYAGTCSNCGKAVRDIPESSFRDDKLYQLTPEDDAPDPEMHGNPVNLCGSCYVDSDMHEMAHRMPKMFGWHYPGAKTGSCPECDRHAMDEADEDLRP